MIKCYLLLPSARTSNKVFKPGPKLALDTPGVKLLV